MIAVIDEVVRTASMVHDESVIFQLCNSVAVCS
jgi:hypothetical protein